MTNKQKKMLCRILASAVLYAVLIAGGRFGVVPADSFPAGLLMYLVPYAIVGWDIVYKAVRNILHGQVFDENFLMFIATLGALAVGEYSEAVAVMLFYQVGELFQNYAVNRSRQSITELMDICPEYANIEEDGQLKRVDPDEVEAGTVIVVKAGERIPLDGIVIKGDSMVDTSSLTGESVPKHVHEDSEVISGCVNGNGVLYIRTTREFDDSTVARILELVENASSKKAHVENFITRFAKYYTPAVVCAAVLLAAVMPLITGGGWLGWLQRACIFLVISCPCALVISVPLSFFGGIGAASRQGILVKGSNYLEAAAKLETVVFDKTGTLTKGQFTISKILPADGAAEEDILETAAHAESFSNHPVAQAVKNAYIERGGSLDTGRVSDCEEISGHGVRAKADGSTVLAGNEKLLRRYGVEPDSCSQAGSLVYVAKDGRYMGCIVVSDILKPQSIQAVAQLKKAGVKRTVMLTGDGKEAGEAAAAELCLDSVYTQLLPADKVSIVEKLLEEKENGTLAFVGDGINDAPVLTRADVGIAMGSMGSDAAIEAADIVLMDDDPLKIAKIVKISRMTLRIVRQNIIFALGVKAFVLLLGAFGLASMWEAVFADVGVSVIAICNAMRTLGTKNNKQ